MEVCVITSSIVIHSPTSTLVPHLNPGDSVIWHPYSCFSASQISWSHVPMKLPRR